MSLGWIGADRITGTIIQLFASLTMNANSLLGRANAAAGAPEQIAVADNTIVGRNGGVVNAIAMATNTVLTRAAGNIIAQAVAVNEVIGRLAGNLGAIPAVSTATVSSVMTRDAAGRAAIIAANADDGIPARTQLETKRNGGIATAIWYLAVNPAGGQTTVIGADTYEYNGIGGNINVVIGALPINTIANLVTAINTLGTSNVRADAAVIGGVDCAIVQSAVTPGGAATPADPNLALNETCAGAGNEWDCGNVNMNTLSGEAYAYNSWGQIQLTITAAMLAAAAGTFAVGTFPFTPRIWTVQCMTAGGVLREISDAFALQGNSVICTFGGGTPLIATDIVIVTAQA